MLLLVEAIEDFQILTEETESGKKRYMIEGMFMQSEKVNRNKRLYPFPIMEKEVNRYIKDYVEPKKAYVTYAHGSTPKINENDISHRIRELHMEGNDVYGKASILDNPNGNMIKSIIDDGGAFGMSSKALGTVYKKGDISIVKEDLKIRSVDCVLEPSGIDCWVNGLIESTGWVYNPVNNEWIQEVQEQIEEAKVQINEVYRHRFNREEIENASC